MPTVFLFIAEIYCCTRHIHDSWTICKLKVSMS